MHKYDIILGFVNFIKILTKRFMKNSKKFLVGSLIVALAVGILSTFALSSGEDLTGRTSVKNAKNVKTERVAKKMSRETMKKMVEERKMKKGEVKVDKKELLKKEMAKKEVVKKEISKKVVKEKAKKEVVDVTEIQEKSATTPVSAGVYRSDGYPDNQDVVVGVTDYSFVTVTVENYDLTQDLTLESFSLQDGPVVDIDGTLLMNIGVYEHDTNTLLTTVEDMGSDDYINFSNLNYVLPAGSSVEFDIKGDVSLTWPTVDDLQLFVTEFDVSDSNGDSEIVEYPPECAGGPSYCPGEAVMSANFDLNNGGVLAITFTAQSDSEYESLITPTGDCMPYINNIPLLLECTHTVAELQFHPENDSVLLQKLVLHNDDNTDDFSDMFETFFLVDIENGDILDTGLLTDTGMMDDGMVTFDSFSYLINQDDYVDLAVLTEVDDINEAYQSSSYLNLYLDQQPTPSTLQILSNSNAMTMDVTDTSTLIDMADDGDDYQQMHITRKSIPTVSYNNGNIVTEITGSVAAKEVYEFEISADSAGDVDWKRVTFDITDSGIGISSNNYQLYLDGYPNPLNVAPASISGGEVIIDTDMTQRVSAGISSAYVLKADLTITDTTSDQVLSIELTAEDDTTLLTDSYYDIYYAMGADFIWSDRADMNHTLYTNDWTNGYLINYFDVETVNIAYQGVEPAEPNSDLVVTDIEYDFVGHELEFIVQNIGNEPVREIDIADEEFAISISQNGNMLNPYFEPEQSTLSRLSAGGEVELSFPGVYLIGGNNEFEVCVDVDEQENELDESNNCMSVNIGN
jgi:hypothetical protein